MAELFLIVRLAGERVAFPASEVNSLIDLEQLTPVPRAPRHVAGLAALRSRILTVIDCRAALGAAPVRCEGREAVVVPSDGHLYALVVDGVEDVMEASAPPSDTRLPLALAWGAVARNMVELGGDLLLLVDPHALVAGSAAEAVA
jgi:purine-binding chemotaxis protein CheW